MAKSEQSTETTRKTQPKRLARAKVRRDATEASMGTSAVGASRSTKARAVAAANKAAEAERKQKRKDLWMKIAVGVFAAAMVLTMIVPSFAAMISSLRNTGSQTTEINMELIDASYSTQAEEAVKELEGDPENLEKLMQVGEMYLSWGYMASNYASGEEEIAHANELLETAKGYFDQYLEKDGDATNVKVDRALCQLYGGDYTGARTALEEATAADPSYGPGWANLGLACEVTLDTESAKAAYEKAIETDPNDENGAKTYAEQRLEAIKTAENAENAPTESLADTLAEATGTSN